MNYLWDNDVIVVTSTCCYHQRRLQQICSYVSPEIMIRLMMPLLMSRIDHCNAALVVLTSSTVPSLRWVQNEVAGLILGLSRQSPIFTSLLPTLTPVKLQIMFKVATIVHNILCHHSPSCFDDLITFHTIDSQWCQLQSSATRFTVVCQTRMKFGRREFPVCGPDTCFLC